MASSLISNQNFVFKFPYISLNLPKTPCFLNTCISTCSSSTSSASYLKMYRTSRASSEDLPAELLEDSKFVPLNSEDPKYGPPALLLLGFQVEEAAKIQQLLKELDGEFLEVSIDTGSVVYQCYVLVGHRKIEYDEILIIEDHKKPYIDMINRSLWEAVNTKQPNLEASKVATSFPRICFLSGLTGEEMMMFIDAFPESGLEPPVFAALVPNSADKPLSELIEEIMGDHEMLSARQKS